jgi:hypothetical protein
MTQLNQPSARTHHDPPLQHSNTFRITSFADPSLQLPWNHILAKNIGGGGPSLKPRRINHLRSRQFPDEAAHPPAGFQGMGK